MRVLCANFLVHPELYFLSVPYHVHYFIFMFPIMFSEHALPFFACALSVLVHSSCVSKYALPCALFRFAMLFSECVLPFFECTKLFFWPRINISVKMNCYSKVILKNCNFRFYLHLMLYYILNTDIQINSNFTDFKNCC